MGGDASLDESKVSDAKAVQTANPLSGLLGKVAQPNAAAN